MNPTKYFARSILMAAMILLAPDCLFAREAIEEPSQAMTQDGRGGFILEELVVRRQANVKNVKLEQDGSFTLLTTSPSDIYSALNSGVGAAVNFELNFARHSTVLTADGQQAMETIARAVALIGPQTSFKLLVHRYGNQDPIGRKKLTQSRARAMVNSLNNNHRINSELLIDFEPRAALSNARKTTSTGVDSLSVTVVNLGSKVASN